MTKISIGVISLAAVALFAAPVGLVFYAAMSPTFAGFFKAPSIGPGIGLVTVGGTISESETAVRHLRSLSDNKMVKGILVRVNSPGGGVAASHEIYSEIVRIRDKGLPVVVSMGAVAASGGYYISCPADVIVANPGTMTGSIGVIMQLPIVEELMDKVGVEVETIKSEEHKDIGSPFRKMTPGDRELLQKVILDVYDQFTAVVLKERDIEKDRLMALADGRIMTGRQAYEEGLVDTLGTFEDAKRICGERAGIKGYPKIITPPKRLKSWITDLMEGAAQKALGISSFPTLSYLWR
jgi:protease-4